MAFGPAPSPRQPEFTYFHDHTRRLSTVIGITDRSGQAGTHLYSIEPPPGSTATDATTTARQRSQAEKT